MTNPLIEQARWQWFFILESAGIDASYLTNKHGPCPMCGGKDRFRFDDKEGRGTYICTQCDAGNGVTFLMRYRDWSFQETTNFIDDVLNGGTGVEPISDILKRNSIVQQASKKQVDLQFKRKQLNTIWSQSKPITHGDPVDRYLRARGIALELYPSCLRHHPNLFYYDDEKGMVIGKFPAMIGMIQASDGKRVTLHQTYLGDGCKAYVPKPKKLMSPVIPGSILGGAIRLCTPAPNKALVSAEGIETALAVHLATDLPVWATVSATGMERLILPPEINNVVIAADNDYSGRGQQAAANLAFRLISEGRHVKTIMPPKKGQDFADLLLEEEE